MRSILHGIAAVMLCLAILLTLSACGSKTEVPSYPTLGSDPTSSQPLPESSEHEPSQPEASEPETSSSEASQPAQTVTDDPDASPLLHTDITTDELLKKFKNVYPVGSDEYENYVFWCEAVMTDFCIVNIFYDEDGWVTDGKRIFEKEKIAPSEAVNYIRMVPEGFPCDAVIYTAKGKTYMYAIGYNGRDGGISLMEIENLVVDPDYKAPSFDDPETETDGVLIEAFWVSDDIEVFAREFTIESDSKWHVWKALKQLNKHIPTKCSLLSGEMVKGRNKVMALDFSAELNSIDGTRYGRALLQAIANTYITTYDLSAVRFKVEGKYFENSICGYSEEFGYTNF